MTYPGAASSNSPLLDHWYCRAIYPGRRTPSGARPLRVRKTNQPVYLRGPQAAAKDPVWGWVLVTGSAPCLLPA